MIPQIATALVTAVFLSGAVIAQGPANVVIETNGDPFSITLDDRSTSDPRDDVIGAWIGISAIGATIDSNYLREAGAPAPVLPDQHLTVNFREGLVKHPIFTIANQVDHAIYDSYVPSAVRTTFDITYHETRFQLTLRLDTPVYQRDYCAGQCAWPYFIGYDEFVFFSNSSLFETGYTYHVVDDVWDDCYLYELPVPAVCPTRDIASPSGQLDENLPEMEMGYTIGEASADFIGAPQTLYGLSSETRAIPPLQYPNRATVVNERSEGEQRNGGHREDGPLFLGAAAPPPTRPGPSSSGAPTFKTTPSNDLPWLLVAGGLATLLLPLLLLYHRLHRDRVLDNAARKAIYEAVCKAPGIHEAALAERLNMKRQLVDYHTRYLHNLDFITIRVFGRQKSYFQNGGRYRDIEQRIHGVLGRGRTDQLLSFLHAAGAPTQAEIAGHLGVHESSVKWHVDRLEKLNLVAVDRSGGQKRVSLDAYARPILAAKLIPATGEPTPFTLGEGA